MIFASLTRKYLPRLSFTYSFVQEPSLNTIFSSHLLFFCWPVTQQLQLNITYLRALWSSWIEWAILINDKGENILKFQTEDNSVKQPPVFTKSNVFSCCIYCCLCSTFFWRQFVFNIHSLQSRQLKLSALRYNKYFKLTLEGQHLISTGVFNFFIHFVRDKERRGN